LYGGKGDVDLSPEEEYNVRHQDYVMEMPQSGERFRGRENMRAFQRARSDHSTLPRSLQLRRVLVKEGLWVVEAVIDYGGGQVFDVVLISELRDGKMWRAQWVERMEPWVPDHVFLAQFAMIMVSLVSMNSRGSRVGGLMPPVPSR
jgi:hypothetical protein